MTNQKIPLKKALLILLFSICLCSLLPYFLFLMIRHQRAVHASYLIDSVIQTGPKKMALKTDYLCQLMGLSIDQQTHIDDFDTDAALTHLLECPVIKEAHVKTIEPSSVYVDYSVREPLATLYDFENIAVDKEGYLFPLYPFFTPKNLPQIYLGLPANYDLKKPLIGKEIEIAFSLLRLVQQCPFIEELLIKRIDVSQVNASSYGKKEIVLFLEDIRREPYYDREMQLVLPLVLRLSVKNYFQELSNYFELREPLWENQKKQIADEFQPVQRLKEIVINLRIPNLGYLSVNPNPIIQDEE